MPRRSIRAHYEQLSVFERGRIIELKEGGWANQRIAGHMGRSDGPIRRCWQEWVGNGRFQRHDGSGQPTDTEDQEDRLIVGSALCHSTSFIVINHQTYDPHTSVHHGHSQMADRAKFTLVPTTALRANHACTLSNQIIVVLGSNRLESC
ncbi:HTH_Tnp_Tc3_2 domain-containing protein [Trichonephila clavipes]|nr:HTH_Tnp_Tc3_2 domain-containing protein [Trichonephila clavipes]